MLPGEEANIFYKCYLILTTPLRLSEWYLVTVWGTIKIRLWFLKFVFVSWITHTLICICCLYNILGTSLMAHWLRLHLSAGGVGLIPGQGAKIIHASGPKKIKQKQYCNKLNKDFKNGLHQKNLPILYHVLYTYIHVHICKYFMKHS